MELDYGTTTGGWVKIWHSRPLFISHKIIVVFIASEELVRRI
jgi:hypothetical protein